MKYRLLGAVTAGFFASIALSCCTRVFAPPPLLPGLEQLSSVRRFDAGFPVTGIKKIRYRCEVTSLALSPDGQNLLYAMRCEDFRDYRRVMVRESQTVLFRNGQSISDAYFAIDDIAFDSGGQHYAARIEHIVNNRRAAGIILDGSVAKKNWYGAGPLVFHPQQALVAHKINSNQNVGGPRRHYLAGRNAQVVSEGFEFMRDPVVFAPDSTELAYAGERDDRWAIYVGNEKVSDDFDDITAPAFHPQTKKVFFGARKGKTWAVHGPEGKVSPDFDKVGRPHFSATGDHIAYRFMDGSSWSVAVDHQTTWERFDRIGEPVFSADGNHVAWWACDGSACFAMRDGTRVSGGLLYVSDVQPNSDGSAIAFCATAGERSGNLVANLSYFVMVNSKRVSKELRGKVTSRWIDDGRLAIAGFDEFEGQMIHGTVAWEP